MCLRGEGGEGGVREEGEGGKLKSIEGKGGCQVGC